MTYKKLATCDHPWRLNHGRGKCGACYNKWRRLQGKFKRPTREKELEYANRYVEKNPGKHLWTVAKSRAKKRGLDFNIEPSDVIVPALCPALGIPLVTGVGRSGRPGGNPNSPSLDRIDSSKGYVKGNVQVISHLANSMKHEATMDQLRKFALWVLK